MTTNADYANESQEQPAMAGYMLEMPIRKANKEEYHLGNALQWTTQDHKVFVPAGETILKLTPGFYNIKSNPNIGIYFEYTPVKTEGLLRFPQANSERVLTEIQKFWERENLFARFQLTHKRGMLLFGPPGSGKSCTIQLVLKDVVERGGIAVNFCHPELFLEGIRLFRSIQPNNPIVVLMEDIDEILQQTRESEVLNLLDGVELLDKIVFLATTNYPDELGPRIINRPSRFDKRFLIDYPNEESRKLYLEYLFREAKDLLPNIPKWVHDTEGFSLAHLKELFVAVIILGDSYEEAITTLSDMKYTPQDSEYKGKIGYIPAKHMSRAR